MDPDEDGALGGSCFLVTTAAPAPALPNGALVLVIGIFAAIAAVGLLRRRRDLGFG